MNLFVSISIIFLNLAPTLARAEEEHEIIEAITLHEFEDDQGSSHRKVSENIADKVRYLKSKRGMEKKLTGDITMSTGYVNDFPGFRLFNSDGKIDMYFAQLGNAKDYNSAEKLCAEVVPKGEWQLLQQEDALLLKELNLGNKLDLPHGINKIGKAALHAAWIQGKYKDKDIFWVHQTSGNGSQKSELASLAAILEINRNGIAREENKWSWNRDKELLANGKIVLNYFEKGIPVICIARSSKKN